MRRNAHNDANKESLFLQLKDRFGLLGDPFGGSLDFFYHGAGREELVAKAVHTLRFGEMSPLITGEKGIGKTTVLAEIIKSVKDEFKVVILKSSMLMGEVRLLEMLFSKDNYVCPVSLSDDTPSLLLKALMGYLEHKKTLTSPRPNTLIVVDDSDNLTEGSLGLILSAQQKIGIKESGVRWLFTAQHEWVGLLVSQAESSLEDQVYQLPLLSLGFDDTERYVKLRLYKAGAKTEILLSHQQLDGLARLGKGNPGRINRVAPGVLLGMASEEEAGHQSMSWEFSEKARSIAALAGGAIAIVVIVIWLLLDSSSESKPVDQTLDLEVIDAPSSSVNGRAIGVVERDDPSRVILTAPIPDKVIPPPPAETANEPLVSPQVVSVEEIPVESPVGEMVGSVPPDTAGEASPPGETAQAEPPAQAAQKVTPQKTPTEKIEKVVSVAPVAPPPETAKKTEPVVQDGNFRDARWVNQQNAAHFVVQLLGSYNEATAKRFLKQYPDSGFFYIRSTYKGKPWFVVLDGAYSSKDKARAGVDRYPESLKKQKPWIRTVKGIQ